MMDERGSALKAWPGMAAMECFCGHAYQPLLQHDYHQADERVAWGCNNCMCAWSPELWSHDDSHSGDMLVTEQMRGRDGMAALEVSWH